MERSARNGSWLRGTVAGVVVVAAFAFGQLTGSGGGVLRAGEAGPALDLPQERGTVPPPPSPNPGRGTPTVAEPLVYGGDTGQAGSANGFIAVTGSYGVGTSVLAMALAQALGDDARNTGQVVLADLALVADQAMLHGSPDIVPGVSELVEAHRSGRPDAAAVRATTFDVAGRGYDLLLGLRRRRDWAALRPRAVEATLRPSPNRRLIRLPHHINDPAFAAAIADEFRRLQGAQRGPRRKGGLS